VVSQDWIHYFAYGSNMSLRRLRARLPSARPMGRVTLPGRDLRFHKRGKDGSAKCDAFATGNLSHTVQGVLYRLSLEEKATLDHIEGLGSGYGEQTVVVLDSAGTRLTALTYVATDIDAALLPWSWYRHHVLVGAREAGLEESYFQRIAAVVCLEDPDRARDARQRAVHS
jgi:gamma-glutamylcyclotransferase